MLANLRTVCSPLLTLTSLAVAVSAAQLFAQPLGDRGKPWARHVIDDTSRGADGVRLCDVNGDGLPDVTTGWEQGGITRVYVHPGHGAARERWPAVTVGGAPNVEDAVLVDLDADGRTDVLSSCEGGTRTVFVHWAPKGERATYLDSSTWRTDPLPASQGQMMWMFCMPLHIDGRHGVDLVAAGKGDRARIGWFRSPQRPRELAKWTWHPIAQAGWIMSLRAMDLDADGDLDILTTDRKGPLRGCRWLENPGAESAALGPWKNHFIGARDHEVMFMTVADLDGDRADDLVVATKDDGVIWFRRTSGRTEWASYAIQMPENVGTGKGVAVGDVDLDGKLDVVFSCENARGSRSGVMWLSYQSDPTEPVWTAHEISGPAGIKFDRLELLDLDGDGDQDVLGCEESEPARAGRQGLGVFWYENPALPK